MGFSIQYYDLLLLSIGASLGLGAVIGFLTPVALELAVVFFGVVGIAFIGHGLFVNGPVDEPADLADEVEPEKVPAVLLPVDRLSE